MPDDQDNNNNVATMPQPVNIDGNSGHFHFEVPAKPSCQQVIKLMAENAKMINKMIAQVTTTELLSAANPALAALFNASAQLESGAMQLHQLVEQHKAMQQGGLVGPGGGGGVPQQAGRGPQRFN